jgi:uncharacterized protein (DUF934 family)
MQIIKDKQLIDNTWSFVADDAEIGNSGDITVSLSRWEQQKSALQAHKGKVGIRLTSTDDTNLLADIKDRELVELDFPVFTDGRLFSHARLLRDLGYQGEIRAVGNYLADQVFYLNRVGVNAFQTKADLVPLVLKSLDDFSVKYQTSSI